jgi:hypothetical protein
MRNIIMILIKLRAYCMLVSILVISSFGQNTYRDHVSLVELITKKDEYHGKKISVSGYVRLRFEECAIYLSSDDARMRVTKNGIWMQFSANIIKQLKPIVYDRKWVFISGVYNKIETGHLGMYSGGIDNIDHILLLSEKK